ncbi:hypothetical protein ACLOJK_013076 [Asimina triloba]
METWISVEVVEMGYAVPQVLPKVYQKTERYLNKSFVKFYLVLASPHTWQMFMVILTGLPSCLWAWKIVADIQHHCSDFGRLNWNIFSIYRRTSILLATS